MAHISAYIMLPSLGKEEGDRDEAKVQVSAELELLASGSGRSRDQHIIT